MVIVEFKNAAFEYVFDMLDKAKHHSKKTKTTLCDLEDALWECYEAFKDDDEYDSEEEGYAPSEEEDETELGLRRGRRSGMRHDGEDWDLSHRRTASRRGMRMRRNKMGRYY